jgi:hypothetical protein
MPVSRGPSPLPLVQLKLIALCALLLSCRSAGTPVQTSAKYPPPARDTVVHNPLDRERRLRIGLDSGMILVEVTSAAASVELIAPCGTFLDAFRSDSALARWADEARVLPPPTPDSTLPDKLHYSAIRLGGEKKGPYDNTTFKLVRLDTTTSSSFLLTSTNTAWDCGVRLTSEQAVALFGALRGEAVAGATPYELPAMSSRTREGRPHVSGAWVGPAVDRQAQLKGSYPGLHYPPELRGSGISENVRLMFIVDSTGKARPSSVRLIGTARPVFAKIAIASLLAAEFLPAERHGRPVPTFTSQDFGFSP